MVYQLCFGRYAVYTRYAVCGTMVCGMLYAALRVPPLVPPKVTGCKSHDGKAKLFRRLLVAALLLW